MGQNSPSEYSSIRVDLQPPGGTTRHFILMSRIGIEIREDEACLPSAPTVMIIDVQPHPQIENGVLKVAMPLRARILRTVHGPGPPPSLYRPYGPPRWTTSR